MKLNIFISIIFFVLSSYAIAEEYKHPQTGISFNFGDLAIDQKSSRNIPFSVIFMAGTSPFAVSVHFKEEASHAKLDDFISQEKANQKNGGYESEISMTKSPHAQYVAYEIV